MKYICRRHRAAIVEQPAHALQLWRDAMDNGEVALGHGNVRLARSFFGTAYEIAVIHVHQVGRGQGIFQRDHLLEACQQLTGVLTALGEEAEAMQALHLVQDYLLIAAGDVSAPMEGRQKAMDQFRQLGQKMIDVCSGDSAAGGVPCLH